MPYFSEAEIAGCVAHLQNLIRINTTNPPGNEIEAVRYLKNIFDQNGIPYEIVEPAPARASIIARLKGDGSQKPLLLTSHLDVVPAEKEHWQVDPFSGEIKDGFVWGRGAVDMKQMTALELAVLLKAKQQKLPLKRDLIFAAIADEENGCAWGSKWLVQNRPELVQAEYALNEVGGFSITIGKTVFYPIGVAEKGVCWFTITAKGMPGHGAMPHDDQAIGHICLAAHRLAQNNLPLHKTELVSHFIDKLATHQGFPKNLILKAVKNATFSDLILKHLMPDKSRAHNFRNMLRNLATPTLLAAGYKTNVIPSEATVTVDGRVLPGFTVAQFLAEVQEFIGPKFEINVLHSEEACEIDYHNNFYDTLCAILEKHDPGCVPVPFLIPGFTDAKHYDKIGIKTFGFAPTKLPPDLNFGALYHGHNERLPVSAIGLGLEVLWEVLQKTCL